MARGRKRSKANINNDGLRDALSSIGSEKDILATGVMGFANYVTRNAPMLASSYRSNIWVKKSVSIPAQYAVKGWRKLEDDIFEDYEAKLNLKGKTAEALQWSLLFGGSMAFMVVDDGLSPDKPLNLNNLKPDSFKKIIIVDRAKVSTSGQVNQDIFSDNFQEPDYYLLTIGQKQIRAHHTRCHKFVVNKLPYDETVRENYWGVSQIEIIYRQLINDDVFLSSMANMMKKATTDIFGIPGLAQMIKSGNEQAVSDRIRVLHSTMSTLNAFVKDAGHGGQNAETYERITQQFAGFDAMDIQSLNRLSAAAEIPATIFLGKSPDGMNATGTSDLSIFSDRLTALREIDIDPFLLKVDTIIANCHNTELSDYEWLNPFPKSELDDANIRKANMDVIAMLHQMEASNKIIANQMAKHGIIDNDEVYDMVSSLELEPYEIEDIEEELNMDEKANGTYVSMNVKNGKDIYDWFIKQGVEMESPENLHCTVSFSRKEFNHTPNMKNVIIKPSDFIGIEPLGDEGATVLKFNSDEMQSRFNKCMSEGATYDYDSYIPHITLTYNGKDLDLSKIELPNFDLVLGNEIIEPLDLGWKEKTDTYNK